MRVKDLKRGDVFEEYDMGMCIRAMANEDARLVKEVGYNGYACRATIIEGDAGFADEDGVVEFFESHSAGAYGLDLVLISREATTNA